jgi:hypothetical protein
MSYEPTLIISRDDLRGRSHLIEEATRKKLPKKPTESYLRHRAAIEEIEKYLNLHGVKIKEVWIIIVKPELTAHNRAVREALDFWDIEYAIDY